MSEIIKQVHKFEQAKLGKAPYTFLKVEHRESENPTSCQYCGTNIINVFHLESADGKKFQVGSDCVEKSDDSGLIDIVTTKKKEMEKAKREAKKKAHEESCKIIIEKMIAKFPNELLSIVGPFSYKIYERRNTMLAWAEAGLQRKNYEYTMSYFLGESTKNLLGQVAKVELTWKKGKPIYKVLEIY